MAFTINGCTEDPINVDKPSTGKANYTKSTSFESFDSQRISVQFPADGLSLGEGYDILRGKRVFNSCIENYLVASESSTNHDLRFQSINSEVDIQRTRRSSISAGGAYGMFSASASRKSSQSYRLQQDSQKVLVSLDVIGETFYIVPRHPYAIANNLKLESFSEALSDTGGRERDFRLTTEAVNLLNKDIGEFFRYCGNGFTSSFHTGGNIEALIQRTKNTTNRSRSLARDVEAGFGAFSASAGDNEKVKEKNALEELSVTFGQKGGLGGKIPTSIEGLSEAIANFGDSVSQDYSITSAEIVPYYDLILTDDRIELDKNTFNILQVVLMT